MMKPNETAGAAMMLSTFAKNRLFIKSFLSILMLLMLFCTPDALKANASFDTSVTTSFVPSEYLPLETEQATAVGIPAQVVRIAGRSTHFADEVDQINVQDPVEEKLDAALSRLEFLEKLMDEQYLKSQREETAGQER